MRSPAFTGSVVAGLLASISITISAPASTAAPTAICKGLKIDAAKISAANKEVQETTIHRRSMGVTPDACNKNRIILPAILDMKRIISLDPEKCGVTDARIQWMDDAIRRMRNVSEGCGI
jgi:hypothetical protein